MHPPIVRSTLLGLLLLISAPARFALADGAPGATRTILIDAGGRRAIEIAQQGDTLRIATTPGEPALIGEARSAGKRKYRMEGGAAVAEVKLKGEAPGQDAAPGFKVRAPDGRLLWKVKIAGEKIKISADEEGAHPFVLSLKQGDKVKVTGGDERPLGLVHYRAGKRITVEDVAGHELYSAAAEQRSALFGVLLLDAIPARERQILMAELLAAGL